MKKVNIVLLAGKGQRFVDAGYKPAKPLLPIAGKPMILRAIECMPPTDKWVFVLRPDMQSNQELIAALKEVHSDVEILIDGDPKGQLNSCLVAREFIEHNGPVFVGACDFGMVYNRDVYNELLKPGGPDLVSFSFTGQKSLELNPTAWGWLDLSPDGRVQKVSVKVPISNTPINDHVITGSFTFRTGTLLLSLAKELMQKGVTIKGEYYIDSLLGVAAENGLWVQSFPVEFIGWGTPADYEQYLAWEKRALQEGTPHEDISAFFMKYADSELKKV